MSETVVDVDKEKTHSTNSDKHCNFDWQLAPPGQSLNTSSAEASEDEGAHPERSSQILDEKSRQKKLKERMASRKRERRRSIAPVPDEAGATGGAD